MKPPAVECTGRVLELVSDGGCVPADIGSRRRAWLLVHFGSQQRLRMVRPGTSGVGRQGADLVVEAAVTEYRKKGEGKKKRNEWKLRGYERTFVGETEARLGMREGGRRRAARLLGNSPNGAGAIPREPPRTGESADPVELRPSDATEFVKVRLQILTVLKFDVSNGLR